MSTPGSSYSTKEFVSTVIRVAKERSSCRTVVAVSPNLNPLETNPYVEYIRTGRTDSEAGLPSSLLAHQLNGLIGHSVLFTTAPEPSGHVTRITGVRDLGIDPDYVADDPRTPAPEPYVVTPNAVELSATEVEFTGLLTEIYDIDHKATAIRLDIDTDLNPMFLVYGHDDEAEAIRSYATALISRNTTIAAVAAKNSSHGAALLLTRIYES